jgi:diketogulonate reductase-like aldo/keto reductase
VNTPKFLYGTAWKEAKTQGLTELALRQGFRAIDTANQRKHYDEAAVGLGIAASIDAGIVSRSELFLQTKFTHKRGQDHRLPYDPNVPTSEQVIGSFEGSLIHLQTDYLDSYVLHGPSAQDGLARDDWAAWRAMESLHAGCRTHHLGISNVSLHQLESLCDKAKVAPDFVQNRCYASMGWDREIRAFCKANGITYQGFSLLTANRDIFSNPKFVEIANRQQTSPTQIIFCFALAVDMVPLTGTSNADHMKLDLAAPGITLTGSEIDVIENLLVTRPAKSGG